MNLTFGAASTDNPRPFKCHDCKSAFRIHGHLAKHLRSKIHILKLECLGKLPFGVYAEMERAGAHLANIDTTDCESSLMSLQVRGQGDHEASQLFSLFTVHCTLKSNVLCKIEFKKLSFSTSIFDIPNFQKKTFIHGNFWTFFMFFLFLIGNLKLF